MEQLILDSQQRYPDNLDAGIEYAMRELEGLISNAERGDPAAVAEVRAPRLPIARLVVSHLLGWTVPRRS